MTRFQEWQDAYEGIKSEYIEIRDLRPCPTCWAVVTPTKRVEHDVWHESIKEMMIEHSADMLNKLADGVEEYDAQHPG